MLVIVVDDIIVCTNDEKLRSIIEETLDKKFKIKAFGDVKSYVGLELEYKENVVILRQKAYILKLSARALWYAELQASNNSSFYQSTSR